MVFLVWDVGGQEKIRALWQHYFSNTQGLVYVIDSLDRERVGESRDELHSILNDDRMFGVPVVIIANKADLPNVMDCKEIVERLELNRLNARQTKWFVQSACALTGEGIYESFEKMSSLAKERKINGN